MDSSLKTTTTNSGVQATTQTPQASAAANGVSGGTQSSGVQPGTTNSLLTTSAGGVPLTGGSLTTVNLGSTPQSQTTQPLAAPRHVNPALFGFSIVLFVVAIFLFMNASRSAKKTTI